jgi:hypothetical protein
LELVELVERLTLQLLGEHQAPTRFFQVLPQPVVVVLKVMQVVYL